MAFQGGFRSQSRIIFDNPAVASQNLDKYELLRTFISEVPEPYQSELSKFLCPIFIELYSELVRAGHFSPAKKIYMNYYNLFKDSKYYSNLIEILPTLSAEEMNAHAHVIESHKIKHKVAVSKDGIEYLVRFLEQQNLVKFWSLINLRFEVYDLQNSNAQLFDYGLHTKRPPREGPLVFANAPSSSVADDHTAAMEQPIIKAPISGSLPLPSLFSFTVLDMNKKLLKVDLSSKFILAASFQDSSINLWNLENTLFVCSALSDEVLVESNIAAMTMLRGHTGPVYGLSFCSHQNILVSCSGDCTAITWNMHDYTQKHIYHAYNCPMWDIDTSPLGPYFATACPDHNAKLFNLNRTTPQLEYVGHSNEVDCVKFHPKALYVATGSRDSTVRLWDTLTGATIRVLSGHEGAIYALAFSPDGKYLASAGEDRSIKVWHLSTFNLLNDLRGHTDVVYNLCFNEDGTLLASCGREQFIKMWDVRPCSYYSVTLPSASAGNKIYTSPEHVGTYSSETRPKHFVRFGKDNLLVVGAAAAL